MWITFSEIIFLSFFPPEKENLSTNKNPNKHIFKKREFLRSLLMIFLGGLNK